jgi:long-chain acyl-CoA synthetase
MPIATLTDLFEQSVVSHADRPLLWEKRGGAYVAMTYVETQRAVYAFSAGLVKLGVCSGDRIGLIAEGRNDWVISELAIFYAGAINVPLSVKLHEGVELQFRLRHAECRYAIVSASQATKVRQLRSALPLLKTVIVLDPIELQADGEVSLVDVRRLGEELLKDNPSHFQSRRAALTGSDPATICYTSGTTADPKGVILTHRNYVANVEQSTGLLTIPHWYCSLLILPWDHCFAHTAGIYTLMRNGASMASVQVGKTPMETLKNIQVNMRESRPTFLLSVPALAKNFRKGIESAIQKKGSITWTLFRAGLRTGYAYNADGWRRGRGLRLLLKPLVAIFDALFFAKIRASFGGRLEFFIGGGALLDIELQRFFYAIGIPMLQGYGLSEASPVISANVMERHKLGSSGSVVSNLEVRICDEHAHALGAGKKGEIVVRGDNIMAGYWKNEKATREVLRDGWLYTGDLGYLDSDGFLYVLGRTKSLLIANDGEKYSPEGIEETICSHSHYIDQMMLYNNQSPFTVGLVVINKEAVSVWMQTHNHNPAQPSGQCAVLNHIQREINAYRVGGHFAGLFPDRWLPAAIAVLPEPFNEQNGFLNSTMKMVRGKIAESYEARIRQLFTSKGKDHCSEENKRTIYSMFVV